MQSVARVYALSKRNIILRYKNSIAGFFWGFIKPLLYLLIFIVIFSSQFSSLNNYVLFATSGLIYWFFFSNVTNQAIQNIISSTGLIKAVNIPIIFYPLSEMLSELFNMALTLVVFLVVMHWFGLVYSFKLLLIIPATLLFAMFSFGVTLMLSSLNVFFRDVGIMWNTVQPALFYLTPIAYPESLIPDRFKFVTQYNPIFYFIRLVRNIFYENSLPPAKLWIYCFIIASVMYVLGNAIFNKLKNQFISTI